MKIHNTILSILLGSIILSACGGKQTDALTDERGTWTFQEVALPSDSGARFPHLLADARGRLWMSWLVQHRPDSASLWRTALDPDSSAWQLPERITAGRHLMVNWADTPIWYLPQVANQVYSIYR
ncbi:hypothetical protein [Cesiribacter andamanensis]|uniref:Uncharacterized protein n=1 Tax=Cesiribacter andamanensis AMV16 TaxID=1279009 RepID=M7NMV7_9BACT|nr:hypothetical protein [Cesiribacter andamanensis]EMR03090.1 hypothetical protein ADICEAN_01749 [Cesiribacter andamanensis AMV16]